MVAGMQDSAEPNMQHFRCLALALRNTCLVHLLWLNLSPQMLLIILLTRSTLLDQLFFNRVCFVQGCSFHFSCICRQMILT